MLILSISSLLILNWFVVLCLLTQAYSLAPSLLLPRCHFTSQFYYMWYVLCSCQVCIPLPRIQRDLICNFSPGTQVSSCVSTVKSFQCRLLLEHLGSSFTDPYLQQPSSFFNINILLAHPCHSFLLRSLNCLPDKKQ